jgi:hypothetical protein
MPWDENTYRQAQFNQSKAGKDTAGIPALSSLADDAKLIGVCDMLTAKWIRMLIKEKYKTAKERMGRLDRAPTMRKAIIRHLIEGDVSVSGPYVCTGLPKNRLELRDILVRARLKPKGPFLGKGCLVALSGYGLKYKSMRPQIDHEEAVSLISSQSHVCFYLVITTPLGEHTTGCRGGPFFVEYFDPNFGEYKIPTIGFAKWFDSLVHDHYHAEDEILLIQIEKTTVPQKDRRVQWTILYNNIDKMSHNINKLKGTVQELRAMKMLQSPGLSREDIQLLAKTIIFDPKHKSWSNEELAAFAKILNPNEQHMWAEAMFWLRRDLLSSASSQDD